MRWLAWQRRAPTGTIDTWQVSGPLNHLRHKRAWQQHGDDAGNLLLFCIYLLATVPHTLASFSALVSDAAGLLLRELGHESSDVLEAHAGEVAPPAYMAQVLTAPLAKRWRRTHGCLGGAKIKSSPPQQKAYVSGVVLPAPLPAQFDEEADVAAVWREVWEESTASAGAGLRLHMTEVVKVRRQYVLAEPGEGTMAAGNHCLNSSSSFQDE